jgi:hypothetical protein
MKLSKIAVGDSKLVKIGFSAAKYGYKWLDNG